MYGDTPLGVAFCAPSRGLGAYRGAAGDGLGLADGGAGT